MGYSKISESNFQLNRACKNFVRIVANAQYAMTFKLLQSYQPPPPTKGYSLSIV